MLIEKYEKLTNTQNDHGDIIFKSSHVLLHNMHVEIIIMLNNIEVFF